MPVAVKPLGKVKICIDRGGTFCDVIATSESKGDHLVKLLSVDPQHYPDAPREGVRRVLEWFTDTQIPRDQVIDTTHIEYLRMGTTVATNALLERKGERCALVITKGFKDGLEIGTQTRPHLFELAIKKPDVLYSKVIEVDERVAPEWFEFEQDQSLAPASYSTHGELVEGVNGAKMRLFKGVDEAEVMRDLQGVYDEGYRSIAIVLVHSYLYPIHEKTVERIARKMGFTHISVSSDLQAMINLVSRGGSATADAYLTPEVTRYLQGFAAGFKGQLRDDSDCRVSFMQSDGALCDYRRFTGLKAILSGPAGGVVGFAKTSYDPLDGSPVIGFDMGGTSTDVSRYGGSYEHVFETTTAGVTIQTPQLDINTVAAGGGSILFYRNGLFLVGPESAGAHPGPACYRKGGPLTVTDANVFLGRIHVDSFPKIFGPAEDMPLDYEIVKTKFEDLTKIINQETGSNLTAAQVACGFINVANTAMARPIRALTEQRGFRTSAHNLACFGGAGGQHACALAQVLGMHNVIIHKYSSLLSAYGMALADVAVDNSEPFLLEYGPDASSAIEARFQALEAEGRGQLVAQGIAKSRIKYERYLNLKYRGSDTKIMILQPETNDFAKAFEDQHKREFAFNLDSAIDIENIRVRAVGLAAEQDDTSGGPFVQDLETLPSIPVDQTASFGTQAMFFEEVGEFTQAPLFRLEDLAPGTVVQGPGILLDKTQTIVLHPQNVARILNNCVYIDVGLGPRAIIDATVVDPIQLSIFSHRFMGIAEQMGRALQKTAMSVQIKERLDFSCAIFGPDAALVANAPNVPVHLGSMQYAVEYQAALHKGQLRPGDILVSNRPIAGGTHLPDLTVIQPVFDEDDPTEIVFWVAGRGHHGDIGGLDGNSMPPNSTEAWQEGVAISSMILVRDGQLNEEGLRRAFEQAGSFPGCLPPRQPHVNISDLKAKCSACAIGSSQIHALFKEYGKEVVQHYMGAIRNNAEIAVRELLKTRVKESPLIAEEYMDDGAVISLRVDLAEDGSATFDFTGTSLETYSNLNIPPAVVRSAIMYCLRVLVAADIPMNAGVLEAINVVIPPGTMLRPSDDAAVSSGNTETSQRCVDVIFKAFQTLAGSQGTMNYTALDYKEWCYAETICGGAGAGPGWHGQAATHVHMSNTRICDVEIAEKRFPLLVREFSIRRGSGGTGQYRGGDGVIREYEARVDMMASHIGERRVVPAYGLHGGKPGGKGATFWKRKINGEERVLRTKPACSFKLSAGERFVIHTPGAGGYGLPDDPESLSNLADEAARVVPKHAANRFQAAYARANGSIASFTSQQETQ